MIDCSEPLVPADVDLRNFPFVPLHIDRLQKSKAWLQCKRTPELAFYLLNLWLRAWHEVPAGSIEDDDDVLCDAAMCAPEHWPDIRERVLRNWQRCSDGRLYHSTVVELALEAWSAKQAHRARTEKAREAKAEKRVNPVTSSVTDAVTDDVTELIDGSDNAVTDHNRKGDREGHRKGERHRNRKESEQESFLKAPPDAPPVIPARRLKPSQSDAEFEMFWDAYPHKVAKQEALKSFQRVMKNRVSIDEILDGLSHYKNTKPSRQCWLNPTTFLNQERWRDQPDSSAPANNHASRSSHIDRALAQIESDET